MSVRPPETTPPSHAQNALNQAYTALARQARLLPIKTTAFYQRKIDAERAALGHDGGPLHRVIYPGTERLSLTAPGEVRDFVADRSNMPVAGQQAVIHKYPDRLLFLPTTICAAHCQYCFRQDVLNVPESEDPPDLDRRLDALDDYLRAHSEIREVILSGGDPLSLSARALSLIFARLRCHPGVTDIRIHSRAPAFAPATLKSVDKLTAMAEARVRLVLHIVHPYELCDAVEAVIRRTRQAGIRLYNQFPLLRKINDDPALLISLLRRLDDLDIRNLSIYAPDPIDYGAAFRLSLKRMFSIMDRIWLDSPSWINATAFTLDSPFGKFRREHLVSMDEKAGLAIFRRGDKEILYHDLPPHLDEPGDPAVLAWKGLP